LEKIKIIKKALEIMNIEKTINIIGIIGVTGSLLFVGAELRLTNKIAQVETEWQLMNNYASWNESVIECPECYVAGNQENSEQKEFWRNYAIVLRALNTWQGSEIAYENGLLSERTFNMWYNDANLMIEEAKKAGTIEIWLEIMDAQYSWAESIVFQYLHKEIEA
jgi:hypothetical protein